MTYLSRYTNDLYALRFSPMCKPAAEVAGVTKLESHSTRGRVLMMWRIAAGHANWQSREVELMYQSTLDSISEAFDLAHYAVSQYMLAARAEIWELGLAPENVRRAVKESAAWPDQRQLDPTETVFLAGEIAQLREKHLLKISRQALLQQGMDATPWSVPNGAVAYALGAREVAAEVGDRIAQALDKGQVRTVIADGPETMWALTKVFRELGVSLPEGVVVRLLSEVLCGMGIPAHEHGLKARDTVYMSRTSTSSVESDAHATAPNSNLGKVFVHDARPACLLADRMANHLAVLPGYLEDEEAFGSGTVYTAPRQLLDALGAERVFDRWTRSLAKSCGSDDGLRLTYPSLAAALANQRLAEAERLGANLLVSDSPLAASFLGRYAAHRQLAVRFLPELMVNKDFER